MSERIRPASGAPRLPRVLAARSCGWGARKGCSAASKAAPDAHHAVDLGDLERLLERGRRAGSPAAGGRASSCRRRAAPPSAGCARPRPRSRERASRPPGRGRPRGRRSVISPRHGQGGAKPVPAPSAHATCPRAGPAKGCRSPTPRPRARPRGRSRWARGTASSRPLALPGRAASAPRIGRISPESDSSPGERAARERPGRHAPAGGEQPDRHPWVERRPRLAHVRGGARFTVMRCCGNPSSELSSAARTRSRDSRTARSGSPTSVNAGRPRTSTDGHRDRGCPPGRRF